MVVLEEMIFPQCEKLGQTIIFVRTREIARTLHAAVRSRPPALLFQPAAGQIVSALSCSGRVHPFQMVVFWDMSGGFGIACILAHGVSVL